MVSPKTKKFIFGSAIFGMLFGTPSCSNGQNKNQGKKVQKTEVPAKSKNQKPSFNQKYKIETRADFDALYNVAEPFIFAIMIPTENWRLDFHNDRQRKNATANSVGVGLYYVGVKNGKLDFSSKTWKKTKSYVISYQNSHEGKNPPNLKPYQLYDGTSGWFKNMDTGRHLKELFEHIKGAKLTINEFAAIASIYYNDEVIGKSICDYVKSNYDNPKKCAQYIIKTAAKLNGIKPRRVHEVLLYLNHDGYCTNVFSLEVDGHLGTSVSGLDQHYEALQNGITDTKLNLAASAIYTRVVKNGHPIRYYIQKDTQHQSAILTFMTEQTIQTVKMDERGEMYESALAKYNAKDYSGALALFQQIVAKDGNSADLYNDMAITYYHLGQYTQCIEQCKKTLKTGDREKYMYATYNAGLAYWALKNYDSAIKNFNAAIKYSKEFGETDNQKIYESKLAKCKAEQNSIKSATNKSNGAKKTAPQNTKKNQKNLKNGTRKVHAMTKNVEQDRKVPNYWDRKQYS